MKNRESEIPAYNTIIPQSNAANDAESSTAEIKNFSIKNPAVEEIISGINTAKKDLGWEESKKVYTKLEEKLEEEEIDPSLKNSLRSQISDCIEETEKNLKEKENFSNIEEKQEKIIATKDWTESLTDWKNLLQQTEKAMQNTDLKKKYLPRYQEKQKELLAYQEEASIESRFDDARKLTSWDTCVNTYTTLIKDTKNSKKLSPETKNKILIELDIALQVSEENLQGKNGLQFLEKNEEKIMKMGYRKSIPHWKAMEKECRFLSLKTDLSKYQKKFAQKATQMNENFVLATLHGEVEDTKESNKSWETVSHQYKKTLRKTESSDINSTEKNNIVHQLNDCIEVSEENLQAKKIVQDAEKNIQKAFALQVWDSALVAYQEIEKTLHVNNEQILTTKRKNALHDMQAKTSNDISICVQNIKEDTEAEEKTGLETLSKKDAHLAMLMSTYFLSEYNPSAANDTHHNSAEEPPKDISLTDDQVSQAKRSEESTEDSRIIDISQQENPGGYSTKLRQLKNMKEKKYTPEIYNSHTNTLIRSEDSRLIAFTKYIEEHCSKKGYGLSRSDIKGQLTQIRNSKVQEHQVNTMIDSVAA